jgi:hypothetical protein
LGLEGGDFEDTRCVFYIAILVPLLSFFRARFGLILSCNQ